MSKILVHLNLSSGDNFVEIFNLNRVWVNRNNIWGQWALMYSDDKYEFNTLFYSRNYHTADSARKKLIEAYKNGKKSDSL